MTHKALFGTDGVRGTVGRFPIDPESMVRLGSGVGRILNTEGKSFKVIIAKDTRLSGYMLESALEAGLISAGCDVILTGPLPTPALGYLTKTLRADLGIMISASHNPYFDNGVKLILPDGRKLSRDVTDQLEHFLYQPLQMNPRIPLGKASRLSGAKERYIELCKSKIAHSKDLSGMRIVLDCANGATYQIAPDVFKELNADITVIHADPDGVNINAGCGSTNPKDLQEKVLETGAHCGIAFDGDGDRVIFVDEYGQVVDGDDILWILAQNKKRYSGISGVVTTIMANGALATNLQSINLACEKTAVGDQHVMQALNQHGWILGAEPSGHIIDLSSMQTGDGIIASLLALESMLVSTKPLSELKLANKWPQIQGSIPMISDDDREIMTARIDEFLGQMDRRARVVIRPSGTEPKLRYLIESEDLDILSIEKDLLDWFSVTSR